MGQGMHVSHESIVDWVGKEHIFGLDSHDLVVAETRFPKLTGMIDPTATPAPVASDHLPIQHSGENPRFPPYPPAVTFHACGGWLENVWSFTTTYV